MNEKVLRGWLKSVMQDDVEWVEPSAGSTLGQPDANITVDGDIYQVELKWGKEVKGRLIVHMRPSQIRFHTLARKKKRKTAIMIGYPVDGYGGYAVEMVSNTWLDRMDPRWSIARGVDDPVMARMRIQECLKSKEFWK